MASTTLATDGDAHLDPELSSNSDDDVNDDGDGWEDVNGDDTIEETFVSLFDDQKFDSIVSMFDHCKAKYNFDVWKIQQEFELDFIGLVKLVNYVRKSVREGQMPDVTSKSVFDDDFYLLPILGSDPVLYNLEEILVASRSPAKTRIEELEEEMMALQTRFDSYRNDVKRYLGDDLDKMTEQSKPLMLPGQPVNKADDDYFHAYSSNAIHETMLKDRIRTDAYRNFIYDNKDLFQGKVVLDVGCGTGILSMFCARAGAKQVIAVDNSAIISTAREIIRLNQLDHKIQCIRGKIEEVVLPVEKVDIIVSEWMGYCLLYESMLDSVIYARDRYLADDGLLVPSHASLHIGIIADSDVRESHVDFWREVYGFSMKPMLERAHQECLIKVLDDTDMSGEAATFKLLDLHQVKTTDLDLEGTFSLRAGSKAERLDGFALWFDIFFSRSREASPDTLNMEAAEKKGMTAFSTGPHVDPTHWQQGICFVKDAVDEVGDKTVQGKVSFTKSTTDRRALDIAVQWQIENSTPGTQSWHLV